MSENLATELGCKIDTENLVGPRGPDQKPLDTLGRAKVHIAWFRAGSMDQAKLRFYVVRNLEYNLVLSVGLIESKGLLAAAESSLDDPIARNDVICTIGWDRRSKEQKRDDLEELKKKRDKNKQDEEKAKAERTAARNRMFQVQTGTSETSSRPK
jgi:hypothetical protein